MRIAILSDIHGNLTAFEAVLADLRQTSPDLILHGGDLADGGASPVEIVDRIRELGWQGVQGNTDEVLWRPESLEEFAAQAPKLQPLLNAIREMAAVSRDALGKERLAWLSQLPRMQIHDPVALVHASRGNLWRAPMNSASSDELEAVYAPLGAAVVVYGHIHIPCVRSCGGKLTVANSGSVGRPHDGDRRASYLLVDEGCPEIRRVDYDIDREVKALLASGFPHRAWLAKILRSGAFQMP